MWNQLVQNFRPLTPQASYVQPAAVGAPAATAAPASTWERDAYAALSAGATRLAGGVQGVGRWMEQLNQLPPPSIAPVPSEPTGAGVGVLGSTLDGSWSLDLTPIAPVAPSEVAPVPPVPAPVQVAPAAAGPSGSQLAQAALRYVGEPYKLNNGGPEMGPGAKNCSGLIAQAGKDIGMPSLVGGSTQQMAMGREVGLGQLQPGDIVYSRSPAPWGHVGLYIGDDKVVHASRYFGKVVVSDMQTMIAYNVFDSARRVF